MIWLDPTGVRLIGSALGGVSSVSVDREASRFVAEFSDAGPHVVFADAPEERVTVRIVRAVGEEGAGSLRPGEAGELRFRVGASGSDGAAREVSSQVVIRSVTNRVEPKRGATQAIECVAVSPDGSADPVSEQPVSG